jgi:hypothetical protein
LSVAADQGATTVSLMLLSASPHAGRWPCVFSLIEMLRGIRHYAYGRPRGRRTPLRVDAGVVPGSTLRFIRR